MSDQTWRNAINNNPIHHSIRQFLNQFPLKTYRSLLRPRELDCPRLYIWGRSTKNSFDQECVKWQVFLKFSKCDFDTEISNEPLMSPSGKLPFLVLTTGENLVDDGIEKFISDRYSEQFVSLSNEQQADSQAYIALADTKLRNALLARPELVDSMFEWVTILRIIFIFATISHKFYVSHYSKPLDKILFHQYKNLAIKELLTRKQALNGEEIYQEAAEALQSISVAFGDNDYFFGRLPTFIDAVIFSYIHVMLAIQTKELISLVQKHSNLIEFSKRINNDYCLLEF
ncbi:14647_t:CDS:2 [Funneliformis geosporum]|uniref:14647_t:CDS:1 n=1 Tax=Funneliformis geosporum TaxID=1117311 RepID=A0A9W4T0Z3_9GLOM|nr:14647_t:CDS:2 [Funneliformis geosporum]